MQVCSKYPCVFKDSYSLTLAIANAHISFSLERRTTGDILFFSQAGSSSCPETGELERKERERYSSAQHHTRPRHRRRQPKTPASPVTQKFNVLLVGRLLSDCLIA